MVGTGVGVRRDGAGETGSCDSSATDLSNKPTPVGLTVGSYVAPGASGGAVGGTVGEYVAPAASGCCVGEYVAPNGRGTPVGLTVGS